MSLPLPAAIATYFEVSNGAADSTQLSHCFAQDAVVSDERHTLQGHAAIQAWSREVRQKYEFSVELLRMAQDSERVVVTGKVMGNFPGSPIELDYAFQLVGGKIQSLEIG